MYLNEAISLAKANDATVTGLFVVLATPTELQVIRKLVGRQQRKQYGDFITKASNWCLKWSVKFNGVIEYGNEGSTIVSYAKTKNFALIVMGARGLGRIKEILLGVLQIMFLLVQRYLSLS